YSGRQVRHFTVQPIPEKGILAHAAIAEVSIFSSIAVALFTLVIAVSIGLRRGESFAMRMLALALLCSSGTYIGTLPVDEIADFYSQFVDPIIDAGAYAVFTFFALIYPDEQPVWRHKLVQYAFGIYVACFAIIPVGDYLYALNILPDLLTPTVWKFWSLYYVALVCVSVVFALGALVFSWWHSRGVVRQRLAWIIVCMGSMYAIYFLFELDKKLGWPLPLFSAVFFADVVQVLALAGFGYAMLRYRLFDFGFAVNRALAVTIISTLLLVLFSITEWGVDKLLDFEGREKNAVFDALVALGVILSFHRIQHWVSHRVDHTFFHHWYKAAGKLRHFLDMAAHISETEALRVKFVHAVTEFCDTTGVAIYALDSSGSYQQTYSTLADAPASIDVNHDVAIELRHSHKVVDLFERPILPCELAFPMTVRGRVEGIALLGHSNSGKNYRPDQIALLSTAVHQFGMDLESLRVEALELFASENRQITESLKQEVEALRNNNRDLRDSNQSLRDNNQDLRAIVDGSKLIRVG
ncbi:MAG: hypothetical protein JO269_00910, partial [Burkholderiaceae bacterium]|nr:hypothetical protein [Burkholderiaceae bacterium]